MSCHSCASKFLSGVDVVFQIRRSALRSLFVMKKYKQSTLFNLRDNRREVTNQSTKDDTDSIVSTEPAISDAFTSSEPCLSTSISKSTNTSSMEDLGSDVPAQPILSKYPRSLFGDRLRSFSSQWYKKFSWLEYSVKQDMSYCFACRKFSTNVKETKFRTEGFSNWKKATDPSAGFQKHELSSHHKQSMQLWLESKTRIETAKTIECLASGERLTDNQKWLATVIRIVKFLVKHGLPLRGEYDVYKNLKDKLSDVERSDGLFFALIKDFIFVDHPEMEEICDRLPNNAKYISPDIQNEIINILAHLVATKIAFDVQKSKYFTICMDGSMDSEGNEMEAIVVRYVNDSCEIEEHVLSVSHSDDISGEGLFNHLKSVLGRYSLPINGIVSQLYDGAAVMAGIRSGVQARLSDFAERKILYVHCFNHQIHLIVVSVLNKIGALKEHFDLIENLYVFFRKLSVRKQYDGKRLRRLIETRWSGHFDALEMIYNNYDDIISALSETHKNKKNSTADRLTASGLLSFLNEKNFVPLTCFLRTLFTTLNIATKQLQSPQSDAASTFQLIRSCISSFEDLRSDLPATVDNTMKQCEDMCSGFVAEPVCKKRRINVPVHLQSEIVDQPLPSRNDDNLEKFNIQLFGEILDMTLDELRLRFNKENFSIFIASFSLLPQSETFFDPVCLKPLLEYALTIPVFKVQNTDDNVFELLRAECEIFKTCVMQKSSHLHNVTMSDILNILGNNYRDSARVLYSLTAIAALLGYSNVSCESLFSRQKKIDAPNRQSMSTLRKGNLTFLYYEKHLCQDIEFHDFAIEWRKKNRKILI